MSFDLAFAVNLSLNALKKARTIGTEIPTGLNKFKEISPDITFMDLTMPVMDGLEALEEIIKIEQSNKASDPDKFIHNQVRLATSIDPFEYQKQILGSQPIE